jgi:transposase
MNQTADDAFKAEVAQNPDEADGEAGVPPRAKRRRISLPEKARILALIDACDAGRQGAILREEGVYASQLPAWRRQVDEGACGTPQRGPKRRPYDEMVQEIKRLKAQVASAERRTAKYELIIEVQKKMSLILNSPLEDSEKGEKS